MSDYCPNADVECVREQNCTGCEWAPPICPFLGKSCIKGECMMWRKFNGHHAYYEYCAIVSAGEKQ